MSLQERSSESSSVARGSQDQRDQPATPHLAPAGAALLVFLLTLVGFTFYAQHVEAKYVHQIAPLNFNLKLQGRAMQLAALHTDDLLPIYGSSDLGLQMGYLAPYHGNNLFAQYPTGFTIFPLGKGGTSPIIHLQNLASAGSALRDRKVVISISPVWFFDFGRTDRPDVYAGNYSRLHAYETVYSTDLSFDIKRDAAARMLEYPLTLQRDPLLADALHEIQQNTIQSRALFYASYILGWLQIETLRLQDHWACMHYVRNLGQEFRAPVERDPGEIPWSNLAVRGERRYKPWSNNNPYGMDSGRWETRFRDEGARLKGKRTDATFLRDMNAADGYWTDLRLVLRTLKELHAQPLILSHPIEGPYYGYVGLSKEAMGEYYKRIRSLASEYGFTEVDFMDHEEDTLFCADPEGHLSPKGWVYFAAAINAFQHEVPLINHTVVIPPAENDNAENDPPEYEGRVDKADENGVSGWAWDAVHPDAPIDVDIMEGGTVFGTVTADKLNEGLVESGKGNGKHGFDFALPDELHDGREHHLTGRVHGTDYVLNDEAQSFTLAAVSPAPSDAPAATPPAANAADDPGTLDEVSDSVINGWAWDMDQPNVSVKVSIYDNDKLLMTLTADDDRPDLADPAVGKGNGKHGFRVNTPASLRDGKPHKVSARHLLSVSGKIVDLNDSPKVVTLTPLASVVAANPTTQASSSGPTSATSAPTSGPVTVIDPGTLDEVSSKFLNGWAWDITHPNTPVRVQFYDGGKLLLTMLADGERDDLAKAGRGNGRHGFQIPTPASLRDGKPHVISARNMLDGAGRWAELNGSPQTVKLSPDAVTTTPKP